MSSDKHKAVFLDRDGVINEERGQYTWRIEDFRINEGVVEALDRLQADGFLLIIISNQGGIAKGLYGKEDVERLHASLTTRFAEAGIRLAEVYYCPHHPDFGKCICRKPESILLEKACARFGIDPSRSWFIGDADRDVAAGKSAGVQTVLVRSNEDLRPIVDKIVEAH